MTRPNLPLPSDHPLLVAYFPLNDPWVPVGRLAAYGAAGVDVVELGLKSWDAFMDGPIVAQSMARATGMGQVAEAVAAAKIVRGFAHQALGVLFCYAGTGVQGAGDVWAEIDAVLCLGRDETQRLGVLAEAAAQGTQRVEFIPHTFDDADVARALCADAYVMVQYAAGVTGIRTGRDTSLRARLARLRAAGVRVPIVAGIGISAADQARDALDQGADGVVTGSMTLARAVEGQSALEDYLQMMREVVRGG